MTVDFDPVIFHLGPLQVRWYGLMYVLGFLIGGKIATYFSNKKEFKLSKDQIDSYVSYLLVGMFFGARLFYVFIYNWDKYQNNLFDIFAVWKGGLSFHGAIFGFVLSSYAFAKKHKLTFFHLTDFLALCGSQGLFFGRMGNFINGELYGRITDVPWGMIFVHGGPYKRHPSQLYEAFGEGLILTLILFLAKKYTKKEGVVSGLFLLGYGFIRFIIEFFREPDSQLGLYLSNTFSMGQILCFVMIVFGLAMVLLNTKKGKKASWA